MLNGLKSVSDFAWLVNRRKLDVFGIILTNVYVCIQLISFILPMGIVFNQIDPISVFIKLVFGYPRNIIFSIAIQILILAFYYPPTYVYCMQHLQIIFTLSDFSWLTYYKKEINILQMPTSQLQFCLKPVLIYKELTICFHILFDFLSNFVGVFLAIIGI